MALREQGATLEEAVEGDGAEDGGDDGGVEDEKLHLMEKLALDDPVHESHGPTPEITNIPPMSSSFNSVDTRTSKSGSFT